MALPSSGRLLIGAFSPETPSRLWTVRGAFYQSRARHQRGDCRSVGAVHEPDRASQRADGAALHPGRKRVSGEQCGGSSDYDLSILYHGAMDQLRLIVDPHDWTLSHISVAANNA